MKIEIQREDLVPALNGVAAVVERRQTLPILSNLLVKTTDSGIFLTATDLELQITSEIQSQVLEPGATTLPAKKFADICKAFPDSSRITLELNNHRASIRSGRSRFSLSTLPFEDYPSLETDVCDTFFDIESALFLHMLDRTSFAMAHQDVRYYLNGLMLEITSGKLICVATDGHRLAKSEYQITSLDDWEETKQIIIPAKTVNELKRLLSAKPAQYSRLEIGSRSILVKNGSTVISSKLIDARYPDYVRVIPSHLEHSAVADREILRDSISRIAVLSYEKQKGVRMTFAEGNLRLELSNPEHEEAQEEVEIDYHGSGASIGFNVGYWLDVLNSLDGESIEMQFLDSDVSAILRDPKSPGDLFVVMPMRI